MNIQEVRRAVEKTSKETFKRVDHFAKVERFIAAILFFTPLILFIVDLKYRTDFRDSISNYFFMCDTHWFGSLLTLAGALFIFNGAQHMSVQQNQRLADLGYRFGKGYNIIFGLALFGVLYFDHITFMVIHYVFAVVFFVGCALAMILTRQTPLKTLGDVLGILTLLSLCLHFLLNYVLGEVQNPFTLLWAEWVGLLFIAIYFIAESIHRDTREKAAGLY